MRSQKTWSEKEIKFFIKNYPYKGKKWCVNKLQRGEGAIRQKASELKLKLSKKSKFWKDFQYRAGVTKIGRKRPEQSIVMKKLHELGKFKKNEKQIKAMRKRTKRWIQENGHPKGMLGKHHSDSTKNVISIKVKKMWKNPKSYLNTPRHRQYLSDKMMCDQRDGVYKNIYSRAKSGHYDINGKDYFFRSSWEPNYALYLDFLVKQGEIKSWEYETDTFWFEKIKRGVRSYKPDFKVFKNDGTFEYHEVKGYMDAKSNTKMRRMKKYYPNVKLVLIDKDCYKDIKNKVGKLCGFYE